MSNKDNVREFDMKKRIFIGLFILFISTIVQAQDVTWEYFGSFSDYYHGIACAGYISDTQAKKIEQGLKRIKESRSIQKLSKVNSWLCWQALSKWDIVPDEQYVVATAGAWESKEVLILVVTIADSGGFSWQGCIVPTLSPTRGDRVPETVRYWLNTFTK